MLHFHLLAFSQDAINDSSIVTITQNLLKEANLLNFKSNKLKTSNFKNNLSGNIFKLKRILDENYIKFSQVSSSDSMFRQSLLIDYKTLKNGTINLQNIEDLIDDLNAKNKSINLGLDQNEIFNIPVEVTTYDSSLNEISGYYVYWNFWLDKNNSRPNAKFPKFTNPLSTYYLTPGVYDIWVQKANSSERFPSLSGRSKILIFLKDSEKKIPVTIIVN
ncbi:MAG: hypothetical protein JWQ25_1340 [Daejeonella sp.]|nr:hypothetical protein [Daejeonella sp.]